MSSLRKVAYNTAVVYLGKVIGIAISTITLAIITRYLGVDRFGDYSTVLAFSAIVVSLTDLGIGWIVTRELSIGNKKALSPLKTFKYFVSAVIVILTMFIASRLGYKASVEQGIFAIGLFTWLTALNSYQVGVLQGSFVLSKTVYADTFSRLFTLFFAFIVSKYDLGLIWLLVSLNITGLVVYFVNNYFISKLELPKTKLSLIGLENYKYDILTMPVIMALGYVVYKVDTLMLAKMATSTEVGIYGAGYRILDVALAIPSIFIGTLAPLISKTLNKDKKEDQVKIVKYSSASVAILAGITATLGFLFAKLAIGVVAGSDFLTKYTVDYRGVSITSVVVLQLLCVYLFFSFVRSFYSSFLLAYKKHGGLIWMNIIGLLVNVLGNYYLIPHYSYFASALLTILTQVVMILVMFISLMGVGWLKIINTPILKSIVTSALVIYLFGFLLVNLNVYLKFPAALLLYFVLTYLSGENERAIINKGFQYFRIKLSK